MLDNIYSWQECGNCQKPEQLKSLFVSGLRCQDSPTCKAWRWRNNVVRVINTDGLTDPQISVFQSPTRRCWLFNEDGWRDGWINVDQSLASKGFTVSGDKSCFEQIYGNNAGCFKQNVKWCFQLNGQAILGQVVENSGSSSGVLFHSWGACAKECEKRGCNYWTWTSSSCTNCTPNNCFLFTFTDETRDQIQKQTLEAPGHISGRQDCTDIRSEELLNSNLDFPVGRCQTPQTTNPQCQGQEVPGYR